MRRDDFRVVIDPGLRDDLSLTLLDVVDGGGLATFQPAVASLLSVEDGQLIASRELRARITDAGLVLNGADNLFYLPLPARGELALRPGRAGTRALSEADAHAFAAFCATAPEADLDEAFVELDHWLVYGAFDSGRLAAAASMYPWRDTRLADLGVITLPSFRGRGIGKRIVRAIAADAVSRGYEPQYRCQLDNLASVALAESAGFCRFGFWDVVTA